MKKAWIFPGQGSQYVGMGKELHDKYEEVQNLFKRAEDITGRPIRKIAFEGPKELLDRTSNTQVALAVVSLGVLAVYLKQHHNESAEEDMAPDFVAGHSAGEYAAAVAAGSMSEDDAIRLVNERGLAMEEAGEQQPGKMAAVLKLKDAVVERIASVNGAHVANYNITDSQVVISGDPEAVDAAADDAQKDGGRVIPLGVSIAAHAPNMQGALERVRKAMDDITIADPIVKMVANKTGEIVAKAAELREMLPSQLTSPVKWSQSVEFLHSEGVTHFIEFGSRDVLSGMIKRQLAGKDVSVEHAETTILDAK